MHTYIHSFHKAKEVEKQLKIVSESKKILDFSTKKKSIVFMNILPLSTTTTINIV